MIICETVSRSTQAWATYDYSKNISSLRQKNDPWFFKRYKFPLPEDIMLVKLAHWSSFEEFFQYFFTMSISFLRGKGVAYFSNKIQIWFPKIHCAKLGLKSDLENFLKSSIFFHYVVLIYSWKRAWFFFWTILNSTQPRMFSAQLFWRRTF